MKKILDLFKSFFNLVEIGILLMILANIWVFAVTNGRTYTKISKIPPRQTALVLGTSPKMRSGVSNPYFTARMDAAALLYHHGKIKKIIVSGEKSKGYDEPANLRALFYARNSGMNALGFDAQDVLANKSFYRNQSREFLARVVAVIYYIFNIEQKV